MRPEKQLGQRAQRKAQRPQEILEAAFEEFVECGYVATRVEDVASRVGVTKGTIYFYFETKEKLFEEMIRHISVPFSDISAGARNLSGSYSERIRMFIRLLYDRIVMDRNTRELLRFVLTEEFIVPFKAAARDILEAGVAAGEFRDGPAIKIPDAAIGATMMLSVWQMLFADRKPQDVEAFFEAHVDVILHGLVARD
jgi:AcrR family transcriptional regulator